MDATTPSPEESGEGQPPAGTEDAHEAAPSAAELLGRALAIEAPETPATPGPDIESTPETDATRAGPDGVPIPKAALDLLEQAGALEVPEAAVTPQEIAGPGLFGSGAPDDVRQVPKAAVALRIELEYGRQESAMAYRALEELGPIGYMARAVAAARRRDLPTSRRDRDAALAAAPQDARLHLIAGVLAAPLREYDRALADLNRAAELGLASRAALFAADLSRRMTWRAELRKWVERGIAADPARRRHYLLTLIQLYEETELREEALAAARELHESYAEEQAPPTDAAQAPRKDERLFSLLRIARLAAMVGRVAEAEEALQAAFSRATPDRQADVHVAAAEVLCAGGAFEKAEAMLQSLLEQEPTAAVAAGLARLALARHDDAVAEAFARRALALESDCESALRTYAACELRKGNNGEAVRQLDHLLKLNPGDAAANSLRAQAVAGKAPKVTTQFDADWQKVPTFKLAAQVMLLAHEDFVARLPGALAALARATSGAFLAMLARPAAQAPKALPPRREPQASAGEPLLIEEVCAQIRASYGDRITIPSVGSRVRLPAAAPEEDAHRTLRTLCVLPPEDVNARLGRLITQYPQSGYPLAAMGELQARLGETKKARESLGKAIQLTPSARDAYVTVGECALLDGAPQEAIDQQKLGAERSREGPNATGRVVRGEALRRLGRFDDARVDLQAAIDANRSHVSAWTNLGLLEAGRGDNGALARAFHEVRDRAPTLLSDAAAELGIDAWLAEDAFPGSADQQRLLEQVLKMLRGNRDGDVVTWFRTDGRMRAITPVVRSPADQDAQDISTCEALVDGYLRGGTLELI